MSLLKLGSGNGVDPAQWTIVLPYLPDSMNIRERSSFWKRKKELQQITSDIHHLSVEQRIPPATKKRTVRIEIVKGPRSRVRDDPANRDSRAKSVLDALVKNGLLWDDSDRFLDWQHVTESKGSSKQTIITISEEK